MKLSTLELSRKGRAVWSVTGPNHCGPRTMIHHGHLLVDWGMTMVCEPTLDEHGFLYDQARIQDFIDELGAHVTKLSCERLVDFVATKTLAKIRTEAPTCDIRSFTFWLSPEPFLAVMTATYHREDCHGHCAH